MLYEMLWKFINWDKSAAAACVRCCLIPLVVGVALWFWLPDTLLGWSTNQGAFIGGAAKWQAVLLIPLLYTAVEVWFIWLVTKSARKRVAGTVFPWVFAAVALLFLCWASTRSPRHPAARRPSSSALRCLPAICSGL